MDPRGPVAAFAEDELDALERAHPEGMSVQQIVATFTERGERLSEATFRKYVQLGLLPRSRRVGRKGKHRGSQGLYPATAIRQLASIRRLMARGVTIEEIQREFLFVRGDIEGLGRQLRRVYDAIADAIRERADREGAGALPESAALTEAREVGADLLRRLEAIERSLTLHARMSRAVL
ncbi:MAG: MerR family transcriptional regulator [Myxococcota bacterium]